VLSCAAVKVGKHSLPPAAAHTKRGRHTCASSSSPSPLMQSELTTQGEPMSDLKQTVKKLQGQACRVAWGLWGSGMGGMWAARSG
jgi:hypothetical protein